LQKYKHQKNPFHEDFGSYNNISKIESLNSTKLAAWNTTVRAPLAQLDRSLFWRNARVPTHLCVFFGNARSLNQFEFCALFLLLIALNHLLLFKLYTFKTIAIRHWNQRTKMVFLKIF
jgi:hypothetical protein